jgi:YYY domain-containing protein
MHPHVLALPFAFVSLAVALTWWLCPAASIDAEQWQAHGLAGRVGLLLGSIGLPLYSLAVIVLGGLSFLNTWDVLIHLFIVVGAFMLRAWRDSGRWARRFLWQALLTGAMLAIPAILLYVPFYVGFRSQAGPPFLLPMLMRPTRLVHFLIIFGMPLLVVALLVLTLLAQQDRRRWRLLFWTAGGLILSLTLLMVLLGWVIASSPEGSARIISLGSELGIPLPALDSGVSLLGRAAWGMRAVFALLPTVILARLGTPWLVLMLALLAGSIVLLWNSLLQRSEHPSSPLAETEPSALPFVLLLILTGALLTVGPEFVYLRDNFGQRLNTIFKFYYQAWVLFGVAALFGLDYLRRRLRLVGWVAAAGYGALLLVALLFPAYGISSRAAEYGEPATLDGIDHYRYGQPDELDALLWLRRNVRGAPVIVEAVGGQYSPQGHGRVSATTGLPTILGWAGHEYQWRGDTPEPAARTAAVETIYGSASWQETATALDKYGVEYIYVGPLEVRTYGPQARTKFEGRLEVAYSNDSVMIYRWLPPERPVAFAVTEDVGILR